MYKHSTLNNPKIKFLKFPLKFKYLKHEVILEVSSNMDTRDSENSQENNDHRNFETLLFKANFTFYDILLRKG